jgi:hypothetical protein
MNTFSLTPISRFSWNENWNVTVLKRFPFHPLRHRFTWNETATKLLSLSRLKLGWGETDFFFILFASFRVKWKMKWNWNENDSFLLLTRFTWIETWNGIEMKTTSSSTPWSLPYYPSTWNVAIRLILSCYSVRVVCIVGLTNTYYLLLINSSCTLNLNLSKRLGAHSTNLKLLIWN